MNEVYLAYGVSEGYRMIEQNTLKVLGYFLEVPWLSKEELLRGAKETIRNYNENLKAVKS